jgi:peptidoglycan/xylan/chitin deacetylase (PgdA/CDA1 family)
MLERFHKEHPDFPLKATFFVLPGADAPHDLFGQKEYKERKIKYLVDRGFEIGNHTFHHHRLDILKTKAEVAGQVGRAVTALDQIVPGYQVRALALPLGVFPPDETWVRKGEYEGKPYGNELVLLATGGGTVPPNHKDWDPFNVTRIQATNEELDFEAAYVGFYDLNPDKRYVSDGNPDLLVFPAENAKNYQPDPALVDVPLPEGVAEAYRAIRLR